MKRTIKRSVLFLGLLFVVYIGGGIVHGTITDFEPTEKIEISATNSSALPKTITDSTFSILTWNVGYAGLSANCHIFYPAQGMLFSHGKMIRPEKEVVQKNIYGGIDFLKKHPADFLLIQEMEMASKRSHFLPMMDTYSKALNEWGASFAPNFKVKRVPTPLLEPWQSYGAAHSGLATFFKYSPAKITRLQLPGKHPWPNSIFHLDRCLSVHRFPTEWGKELIVVNLHNSAYDKGGLMKKQEMAYLKTLVLPEYEAGNYVVVGGDWNQSPPFFPADTFAKGIREKTDGQNIPADLFPENWSWIYDPKVPTVRGSNDNYIPNETPQALIDFFLLSPNCQALEVQAFDRQFEFSDHQAVRMEFRLK